MSPSRPSTTQFARSRRPDTRSESRPGKEDNSSDLEFVEQVQKEAEEELRTIPSLYTDNSSDEETSDQHRHLINLGGVFGEDTMSYPSPKYNDEADAEAQMHAFLTTCQDNHVSQCLSEVDADKSKITESNKKISFRSSL